jgi:hypothetical protein
MVVVVVIHLLQYIASRPLYPDVELGPGVRRLMELDMTNARYAVAQISHGLPSVIDHNQLRFLVSLPRKAT